MMEQYHGLIIVFTY